MPVKKKPERKPRLGKTTWAGLAFLKELGKESLKTPMRSDRLTIEVSTAIQWIESMERWRALGN